MKEKLLYVEQKTGYEDNGPAWIGKGSFSKSGRTIYFNDQAFLQLSGTGISGNYINIETDDEYWISGVKKNRKDRHYFGSGLIMIDESVVQEYLEWTGLEKLPKSGYRTVKLKSGDVVKRVEKMMNKPLE